ncbi:MaoC/PaaZ C-terminal domain-containing protein [Arthrobacter russicus]|jgi:acyl dehydratase|uniref:Acyl dehydratase n=1 Tax=Arthrobacter russicus TaxID=172040 RepID=A0ABU1J5V8_9MICC|nr:MaoC/PaaZ C-terminal domain-containing protein [Arthrobacter russicus]MDR6267803.1 acyl dehydratase [Arthrobacter russicus]
MAAVVDLPGSPSLGGLYAAALKDQALGALGLAKRSKTFPETEFRVSGVRPDSVKLGEFNRLMHGAGRDSVPAGFVHIMSFPISVALMGSTGFPVPLLGLVHLDNKVQQHRRIDPGELLDFRIKVQNPAGHRAGTQFEISAQARAAGSDELLWQGLSTYLARGAKLGLPMAPDHREPFNAPDANALWPLAADLGRRYGAVSGDINPIHTSKLGAKALGLKTTIVHGMYLASRALTAALPAGVEAYRWDVEFATPTFIPGSVAVRFETESEPAWQGTDYLGWNPRSGKINFSGSIKPL